MLKSLAVLALAFAIFPVQTYAQANKAKEETQSDKPSPPVSPIAPKPASGQTSQPTHQEHIDADVRGISTPAKDGYDKTAFWATIALVVAGFAGIGVGVCTLFILKRQTKATEDAAKATSNSVKLMEQQVALQRSQRRGVLEVSCEPLEFDTATDSTLVLVGIINLTNSGEFPLQIRGGNGGFFFDQSDPIGIVGERKELDCINVWIRPKKHGHIEVFTSPEIKETEANFWRAISDNPVQFQLNGFIDYNSLGLNWRRNFAYRWTYGWEADISRVEDGHWEEDPHGQNDEDEFPPDSPVPF